MTTRATISEAGPTGGATLETGNPSRAMIQIIVPGWGSSGYYGPEVLEAAAGPRVFPRGTHMYVDHPTTSEAYELPERSLDRLAAVLTEDAHWDPSIPALVAPAHVRESFREFLADDTMRGAIGASIRATAEVKQGEAEGRRGTIVTELIEGLSVDFVTRAGAGGKILQVMESAGRVVEARAQDTTRALQDAIVGAYGSDESWVWVRDFDPDEKIVYYTAEGPEFAGTYQHGYTIDDAGAPQLEGEPIEVRVETNYVPVDPAGEPQQESGGTPMAEIADGELARLRESDGRVPALESERDAARAERDTAIRERDELRNRATAVEHARDRVVSQNAALDRSVVDRVVEAATRVVPLTDDGVIDTAALDTAVDEARTAEETYLAQHGVRFGAPVQRHGVASESNHGAGAPKSLADLEELTERAFVGITKTGRN